MFGALLGTLQKFRQEETRMKEKKSRNDPAEPPNLCGRSADKLKQECFWLSLYSQNLSFEADTGVRGLVEADDIFTASSQGSAAMTSLVTEVLCCHPAVSLLTSFSVLEEKRAQVEKKLEENAKREKEELKRERQELFQERKRKQAEIRKIEFKILRIKEQDEWEAKHRYLLNFIQTRTKPHIFYLPKAQSAKTEERLVASQKAVAQLQEVLTSSVSEIRHDRSSGQAPLEKASCLVWAGRGRLGDPATLISHAGSCWHNYRIATRRDCGDLVDWVLPSCSNTWNLFLCGQGVDGLSSSKVMHWGVGDRMMALWATNYILKRRQKTQVLTGLHFQQHTHTSDEQTFRADARSHCFAGVDALDRISLLDESVVEGGARMVHSTRVTMWAIARMRPSGAGDITDCGMGWQFGLHRFVSKVMGLYEDHSRWFGEQVLSRNEARILCPQLRMVLISSLSLLYGTTRGISELLVFIWYLRLKWNAESV
ncbi:hypothetical protein PR048_017265 [Dryococelus australis]|uniref:Pinin/SDK/MemA protein domain-containing protein n=1 Tax=Dryococelus australis TaxID=614101 RepID=A0ABQ9H924_9NEOP|nr:hypothetical protein PR048_017265 [Dryococelus australis]